LIIDLTEYLERRRRTAGTRAVQIATVLRQGGRVAQHRAAGAQVRRHSGAVRWSSFLPLWPALELATLYAEASLI
jgi:hypothetical protein